MASCEGKATNVLKYWITLKAPDHRVSFVSLFFIVCLFVFIYIPFILRLFIEDSTIVKFRTKGRRGISENNFPSN